MNDIEYSQQDFGKPNKPNKWFIWLFLALLAALLLSTMAGETIKNLFKSLLSGMTPIIIACVISFLFLKPMNFIENKVLKNAFVGSTRASKYKRIISLSFLYIVTIAIVAGIIVAAVPSIVAMIQQFADPVQLDALLEKVKEMIVSILQFFGMGTDEAINNADSLVVSIKQFIEDIVGSIGIQNVLSSFSSVFSVFMGLVISFLLLKDKELIAKTSRRFVYAYRPRKNADDIITLTRRTRDMLDQYVISNLIVCFIVFVLAWIGYSIMGVPYAFLMAIFLGILCLIPYIGGFIAAIPLLMVTLVGGGDLNLFVMAFAYGIVEWILVTTFLPPIILSKRMNTRALVMVLALAIGGAMFGVVGMILSAPVAAVITVVINERMRVQEAKREHEELVQAGIIDKNFFDFSETLDLTQENETPVTIEEEEDDFKKLQALKYKSAESKIKEADKKAKKGSKREVKAKLENVEPSNTEVSTTQDDE